MKQFQLGRLALTWQKINNCYLWEPTFYNKGMLYKGGWINQPAALNTLKYIDGIKQNQLLEQPLQDNLYGAYYTALLLKDEIKTKAMRKYRKNSCCKAHRPKCIKFKKYSNK